MVRFLHSSRLACAMIGSFDRGRLEKMCAVLQLAARKTQEILLTWFPGGSRHVGKVRIVDQP